MPGKDRYLDNPPDLPVMDYPNSPLLVTAVEVIQGVRHRLSLYSLRWLELRPFTSANPDRRRVETPIIRKKKKYG